MFESNYKDALSDLYAAIKSKHIFIALGWQDVLTRYRRSRVGAFWLTINMLVMITVLGIVFGTLFRAPVADFLPNLAVGIVVWGFLSGLITEGCDSFSSVKDTVLEVKMPLSMHILRVVARNVFIFCHNITILPVVFIFFMRPISFEAILSIFGLFLVIVNATWMILFLSVVCTRFRDMTLITQNIMQVMFYATPIIWSADMLPQRFGQDMLNFNPFYHLLAVVREPLLGQSPSTLNWVVPVLMAIIGWMFVLAFFNHYYKRIPYWL